MNLKPLLYTMMRPYAHVPFRVAHNLRLVNEWTSQHSDPILYCGVAIERVTIM